ncbi:MAG TPA: hypothetical protein VFV50_06790 [Bdellovibrionales bacterium]|nr:hypothetical protein [Bdellovibrionales bacterium]
MLKNLVFVIAVLVSASAFAAEDRNVGTSKIVGWDGTVSVVNIYGGAARALYEDLKLPAINDEVTNLSYQKKKGPGVYCEKRIDRIKANRTKNEHDVEVDYSCTVQLNLVNGTTVDFKY